MTIFLQPLTSCIGLYKLTLHALAVCIDVFVFFLHSSSLLLYINFSSILQFIGEMMVSSYWKYKTFYSIHILYMKNYCLLRVKEVLRIIVLTWGENQNSIKCRDDILISSLYLQIDDDRSSSLLDLDEENPATQPLLTANTTTTTLGLVTSPSVLSSQSSQVIQGQSELPVKSLSE